MRKRLPTVLATPSPPCTSETPGQAAGGSPPTGFLRVYEESNWLTALSPLPISFWDGKAKRCS